MHIVPGKRPSVGRVARVAEDLDLRDRIRAWLINFASRFANWRSLFSGPRVRVEYMREGEVQVALSVLYSFWDEVDVAHGPVPRRGYLHTLEAQLDTVETHVRTKHAQEATVAHDHHELAAARSAHRLALIALRRGRLPPRPHVDAIDAIGRPSSPSAASATSRSPTCSGARGDRRAGPALPARVATTRGSSAAGAGRTERHRRGRGPRDASSTACSIDVATCARRRGETFALLDELDAAAVATRRPSRVSSHAGYRFGEQSTCTTPTRAPDRRARRRDRADPRPPPARGRAAERGEGCLRPLTRVDRRLRRHIDKLTSSPGRTAMWRSGPTSTASSSRRWAASSTARDLAQRSTAELRERLRQRGRRPAARQRAAAAAAGWRQ